MDSVRFARSLQGFATIPGMADDPLHIFEGEAFNDNGSLGKVGISYEVVRTPSGQPATRGRIIFADGSAPPTPQRLRLVIDGKDFAIDVAGSDFSFSGPPPHVSLSKTNDPPPHPRF